MSPLSEGLHAWTNTKPNNASNTVCYGIGISRLLVAANSKHDANSEFPADSRQHTDRTEYSDRPATELRMSITTVLFKNEDIRYRRFKMKLLEILVLVVIILFFYYYPRGNTIISQKEKIMFLNSFFIRNN
jgi:hypothetical protein